MNAPRSDLCVVVVTISEWSKGEGMTPADTRPDDSRAEQSRAEQHVD
jgi:hypothetical protein